MPMLTVRHIVGASTAHHFAPNGVRHEKGAPTAEVIGGPILAGGLVQVLNPAGVIVDRYDLERVARRGAHVIPNDW